ncbi:DUF2169 family type VI secretion system accessory protein [Sorangium sp. So ce1024]|uniref:DUF2169 family type VI secretion system accessory protein n=1 Tax=Sorangium sp. So ce1024 TaxID=3133327 RepID=UPI003F01BA11
MHAAPARVGLAPDPVEAHVGSPPRLHTVNVSSAFQRPLHVFTSSTSPTSMHVVCQGLLRASSLRWRPTPEAWVLTVACHALFELEPYESSMTGAPAIPLEGEGDERRLVEPWGPVAPFKRWAEVLVVGHAHAPGGGALGSLVARLAVGDIDKAVQIRGDSWFAPDGSFGEPAPFTRMPLRWERAAGGPHTANPVGVPTGNGAPCDRWGRARAPNLLPLASSTAMRHGHLWPAGFGPLRPDWPDRAQRLRRHAAGWDHARWAEQALPEGIDPGYFNVAPLDQVTNDLTGAEPIVLEHLHPRYPRLTTRLRAPAPRAIALTNGAERRVPLRCDTLVIDADHGVAALVWRGQLMLERPPREGVVLITEDEIAPSLTGTVMAPLSSRPPAALPFLQAAAQPAPEPPAAAAPDEADARTSLAPLVPAPPVSTPPVSAPPVSTPPVSTPPVSAPPVEDDAAQTLVPAVVPPTPALPFHASALDEPGARTLAPRGHELDDDPPTHRAPPAPPPPSEPSASLGVLYLVEPARPAATAPEPDVPEPLPAAVSELPPSESPSAPALPVDAYPLARCAAIAARLARRPEAQDAILEAEELSPDAWEGLHAHWLDAIRADVGRGKRRLLSSYDAAYVAALEAERGTITAGEYARLAIAAERGNEARTLAELGLPDGALLRLRRVWLERTVKDPATAQELRAAMRRASEDP